MQLHKLGNSTQPTKVISYVHPPVPIGVEKHFQKYHTKLIGH